MICPVRPGSRTQKYTEETANALAKELLDGAEPDTKIAVVSAPSVFVAMKNLLAGWAEDKRPKVFLLEHDERFGVFGNEFMFYDYNKPFELPGKLGSCFPFRRQLTEVLAANLYADGITQLQHTSKGV